MLGKPLSNLADLRSFTDPEVTDLLLTVNRLRTFKGWPFDNANGSKCTSLELAKAGFFMTMQDECTPSAQCVCCLKDLQWEEEDIPLEEHLRKMPHCVLAQLVSKKKEVDMTVGEVMRILSMREVTIAVLGQLSEDFSMINAGLEYNQNFVDKMSRKFQDKE
uniref:Baculoviral IAP repeat-containing protein 6 (inferred by orthology to a human protein) n=1 Tax=Strongyloides venezuelensis TaxID=75913 RepID=A0A0K0G0P1_STRVS